MTVARGPSTNRRTIGRAAWLAALLAVAGCHHFNPRSYTSPESLFQATMRLYRTGNFAKAEEGLTSLSFDLPPRDTLRERVRYYLAECKFGEGDFVTAAHDFRRIADDDPDDPLAPDALLRSGDAYAELWRRPGLDPTNGQTALATWQELISRYPEAPAGQIAQARVREMNEKFATKDYDTGLYYMRRRAYDSAILYFRGMIAQYPNVSIVPDAFVRLVRAYKAIGYKEEMDDVCQTLKQYYGTRPDVRELCGNGNPGR